jgi:hypothetical protein
LIGTNNSVGGDASGSTNPTVTVPTSIDFTKYLSGDIMELSAKASTGLIKASKQLGYVPNINFIQNCGLLWNMITTTGSMVSSSSSGSSSFISVSNCSVIVISGDVGCGKTTIRSTVMQAIKRIGMEKGYRISSYISVLLDLSFEIV